MVAKLKSLWATLLGKKEEKSSTLAQTRLEANRELVKILSEIVEKENNQRFGQILRNYGFVREIRSVKPEAGIPWQNEFYSEPQKILERVKRIKDAIENSQGFPPDTEEKS
jgi:hypothetical protein